MKLDITYLMKNLTNEEKAGLCSGEGFWWTKAVERLGIPSIMVSDGPHGLRKQADASDHLGLNESIQAVCFPAGSALASSWDRELIGTLGEHLGDEARAEKLHTVLGPAINIKRSPLCGRNFEYLSEDPYLAGELSASYVNGIQSRNVGVSVKHFAANNQEYFRMSTDTIVSERALREIYLAAFEKTVKDAKPWTLMCAYNRLNGTYCCEHEWLLKDVLRDEWGFDGIVMTDWGAMNRRVEALEAGLNLEMPSSNGVNDRRLLKALESGRLSQETLDHSVEELLRWIDKGLAAEPAIDSYDQEAHHAFARKAAAECAVLLKNENNLLPLAEDKAVVFIGHFARAPRFQGGGSSHINPFKVSNAVTAAADLPNVRFAPGWGDDGEQADAARLAEAVEAARSAEAAVIFAGLPDSFESEGYDRTHLNLPACQDELIAAVSAVQPNTVVVLHKGSPVLMPWLADVKAVLDLYLGGQAVGEASVDLLFGQSAPAGRLAETLPLRLADTPAYLNFPGDSKRVVYAEDIFVGYRWYDSREMPVEFPFGFGLAYTEFAISNLQLSAVAFAGEPITVTAEVKNIGERAGKEVVQLYVAPPAGKTARPAHELKGFAKVELAPGASQTVSFSLDARSFAYYEERIADWHIPSGDYVIEVGRSSRDLPLRATVTIEGKPLPFIHQDHTTIADIIEAGKGAAISELMQQMEQVFGGGREEANADAAVSDLMRDSMLLSMPIRSLLSFASLGDDFEDKLKRRFENEV